MIILKSIGAFFVRIWRWIKETAWVQPLLIVGAIFAVIFSIPYVTEWAEGWGQAGQGAFYSNYQVSLEGEDIADANKSKADALTALIEDACLDHAYSSENNSTLTKEQLATYQEEKYGEIISAYGEKFFLVYMADDNSTASGLEEGFKYLRDNWNNSNFNLKVNDDKYLDFKIHVINSSEESSNDDTFDITLGKVSAFKRYLLNYTELFNEAGPWLYNNMPYVVNNSVESGKFDNFSVAESINDFPIPSVCLVDFTREAIADDRDGLSEVIFASNGSTQSEKAEYLLDMWNHTDPYSVNNTFTDTSKRAYRVTR